MLASGYPQTKTLLTSRLYPKELDDLEGCLRTDLNQMDKEDAVEFFKRQGVQGTRAEIEEVCRAYGFHPLSLRLLSGMIVFVGQEKAGAYKQTFCIQKPYGLRCNLNF
jgi:hypothetical protein